MAITATSVPIPNSAAVLTNAESQSAAFWGKFAIAYIIVAMSVGAVFGFRYGLAMVAVAGLTGVILGMFYPALGLISLCVMCVLDSPTRPFVYTYFGVPWNSFNYVLLLTLLQRSGYLLRLRTIPAQLIIGLGLLLLFELDISDGIVFGAVQHCLSWIIILGLLASIDRARRYRHAWYWGAMAAIIAVAIAAPIYFWQAASLEYLNHNAWGTMPASAVLLGAVTVTVVNLSATQFNLVALLSFANAGWAFLSASRGSALIAGTGLLFILAQGGNRKVVGILAGAAVAGGLMLSSGLSEERDEALQRWGTMLDPAKTMTSRTSARYDLARGAWQMFLEHPLGVGTGEFRETWATISQRPGYNVLSGNLIQAHSGWAKVLAENGAPGLLLLAGILVTLVVEAWMSGRRRLRTLSIVTAASLAVAFIATEFQGKGYWLPLTALVVLLERDRNARHATATAFSDRLGLVVRRRNSVAAETARAQLP